MPIHDLGYRSFERQRSLALFRWWALADTGIRLAWQNRWLRRMLVFAWLPAFYFGIAFFAYEQLATHVLQGQQGRLWAKEFLVEGIDLPGEVTRAVFENPVSARPIVWRYLLYIFYRSPQTVLLVLAIGLIAPPLIARDIRTRAFILYFSRPIVRLDYVLGKSAVLWAYGLAISTAPALVLYVVAVLTSTSIDVFRDTWDLPLRILGASLILLVPTTSLALMLSSLTTENRYATFSWFAVWVLGMVAYAAVTAAAGISSGDRPIARLDETGYWYLISLFHTLGQAQDWAFGVEVSFESAQPALGLLALLSVVSLAILLRRVSSPMRV